MSEPTKFQNSTRIIAFVDYKPAEIRYGKEWIIVYYAKNPINNELTRFRLRVPAHSSIVERKKLGKRIVLEINKKLAEGWSPFFEETGKNFKTFTECKNSYIQQIEREVRDEVKRIDTLRSYKSYLTLLQDYINRYDKINFVAQINRSFIVKYLDYLYNVKGNSPVSYNNHLNFLGNFCNYLIDRGYLAENPTFGISRKKKLPKTRKVIPDDAKQKLSQVLIDYNFNYYVLCMMTYYTLFRGTELTKLKVSFVHLDSNTIIIPAQYSKNKKTESVTIPGNFKSILTQHLAESSADDFLFSRNSFKPGKLQLKPKRISDVWKYIRTLMGFGLEIKYYSLKDTGLTDLMNTGIPAIKARDQARHHDVKITELYISRNDGCDEIIKNSSINFSG